jgi:hypothetical protein
LALRWLAHLENYCDPEEEDVSAHTLDGMMELLAQRTSTPLEGAHGGERELYAAGGVRGVGEYAVASSKPRARTRGKHL